MRIATPLAILLFAATGNAAIACSCAAPKGGAAGDRAGEAIYRSADLIVDATVLPGDPALAGRCRTADPAWLTANAGRRLRDDRRLKVHRVLKGRTGGTIMLEGRETTIDTAGCITPVMSCDYAFDDDARTVLVLRHATGGHYRPIDYCTMAQLRASARGKALFGTAR